MVGHQNEERLTGQSEDVAAGEVRRCSHRDGDSSAGRNEVAGDVDRVQRCLPLRVPHLAEEAQVRMFDRFDGALVESVIQTLEQLDGLELRSGR